MATVALFDQNEGNPQRDDQFTGIFTSYYKRMVHYSFQFVKNQQAAEDIAQSCFIKLWNKRSAIDFSRDITSLLYTMVRNSSIDHLRSKKDAETYRKILETSDDNSMVRELILTETLQEIYAIIKNLPPKCRNIFELLYIHGMDHQEAAKVLNVAESTIRTQKARALSFIRLHLRRLWFIPSIF